MHLWVAQSSGWIQNPVDIKLADSRGRPGNPHRPWTQCALHTLRQSLDLALPFRAHHRSKPSTIPAMASMWANRFTTYVKENPGKTAELVVSAAPVIAMLPVLVPIGLGTGGVMAGTFWPYLRNSASLPANNMSKYIAATAATHVGVGNAAAGGFFAVCQAAATAAGVPLPMAQGKDLSVEGVAFAAAAFLASAIGEAARDGDVAIEDSGDSSQVQLVEND